MQALPVSVDAIIGNIFGACAMRLWNDDIIVMQNSATAMAVPVVAVPTPLLYEAEEVDSQHLTSIQYSVAKACM